MLPISMSCYFTCGSSFLCEVGERWVEAMVWGEVGAWLRGDVWDVRVLWGVRGGRFLEARAESKVRATQGRDVPRYL